MLKITLFFFFHIIWCKNIKKGTKIITLFIYYCFYFPDIKWIFFFWYKAKTRNPHARNKQKTSSLKRRTKMQSIHKMLWGLWCQGYGICNDKFGDSLKWIILNCECSRFFQNSNIIGWSKNLRYISFSFIEKRLKLCKEFLLLVWWYMGS